MKSFSLIIVITIFFCGFSPNLKAREINEFIRYKIENRKTVPLHVDTNKIYNPNSLSTIYENRIFSLAWKNKTDIDHLIKSIQTINLEGLDPKDYHIDILVVLNEKHNLLGPLQRAELDLLATDAFISLNSDLRTGKVNLDKIDNDWHFAQKEENQVKYFEEAIAENKIKETLAAAIPDHIVYNRLKNALARYQKIKFEGGWEIIPKGETLKKGQEDERIVLIKNRLIKTNDLSIDSFGSATIFDDSMFRAVLTFQERHNLELDGIIGKNTLLAMNISIDDRIDQIKVNLERWRWLPLKHSNLFIHVNIANFSVNVFKDGKHVKFYKAIVGKNHRETPIFNSKISYLVLNPTWTVPSGIINKDIIPGARRDSNYVNKKNLNVLDQKGNIIDPTTINWYSAKARTYTYRQPAGPSNALGSVKFMFPNKFSVYLHDTPSRSLFERKERSFSSGCIRVENALELAEYLLNDSINWSATKIKEQIESNKTLTIPLEEQADIYILYWTAWVNNDSLVHFRKDIYQRDKSVINALKTNKKAH